MNAQDFQALDGARRRHSRALPSAGRIMLDVICGLAYGASSLDNLITSGVSIGDSQLDAEAGLSARSRNTRRRGLESIRIAGLVEFDEAAGRTPRQCRLRFAEALKGSDSDRVNETGSNSDRVNVSIGSQFDRVNRTTGSDSDRVNRETGSTFDRAQQLSLIAATEIQRVADPPTDAAPHGIAASQDVHPARAFEDRSKDSTQVIHLSNRTVESIEKLSVKETQNRFDVPSLRTVSESFPEEIAMIENKLRQVCPDVKAPLGPDGDPAAAQLMQLAYAHQVPVTKVLWALDLGFKNRIGKKLPPVERWGWAIITVRTNLGLDRMPPQRETRPVVRAAAVGETPRDGPGVWPVGASSCPEDPVEREEWDKVREARRKMRGTG